ncbi:PREDICTED: uncharacterized protein LOC104605492 [Nelumbo nucifera]|uniref:Uncharacterized protein LOC104605492 n=1 Tax=Nelumbo nucifera TaxID=4432 RepID=A0A1U8AQM7_NELNU|nr:PREDICTED: uncharacterized protein LOC104605492 [Nelumbo nucifera]XP_010268577.1 PREDICTED: uncharacterized protein LOC104605492 [Nelumbo nucifera]XP_010268578.1 PREDICTED: uncharacterized protein LOC104605492 [Nelumbo nucifera]
MLLAVEGGGFFSSSASGYSKGLTLLLLGRKNEERPMRVSPWNQYQLVDQEADTDFQLASGKNQVSCGCASFVCFGRASAGLESPSPLKVGPTQLQDALSEPPAVSDKDEACIANHGEDKDTRKVCLKSSLKKPSSCAPVPSRESRESDLHVTPMPDETGTEFPGCTERRKVQWTDTCGRELVEIREFELSDVASDEELEGENERSCSCVIM